MDKVIVVYAKGNTSQSQKNNEIWPVTTKWMDLKGTMLSETSQIEENKYSIIPFICRT